jgi:hypothetical protein
LIVTYSQMKTNQLLPKMKISHYSLIKAVHKINHRVEVKRVHKNGVKDKTV